VSNLHGLQGYHVSNGQESRAAQWPIWRPAIQHSVMLGFQHCATYTRTILTFRSAPLLCKMQHFMQEQIAN